jgi:hypothetical protein
VVVYELRYPVGLTVTVVVVVVTVVVAGSLVCLCSAIFQRISEGSSTATVFGS